MAYDTQESGLVRTRAILDEALLLVGSSKQRLTMDAPVEFKSLAGEQLVLPSQAHGLRNILDTYASRAGITLTSSLEVDSLTAMIDLVRGGFGMTILPLAPIHAQVTSGALTAARLVEAAPTRRVLIAYPADRPAMPAARFVGEAFARVASDLVHSGRWAGRIIGD